MKSVLIRSSLTKVDPVMTRSGILACCVLLTVLWAAIYLTNLSTPALFDDADTVHAEAVKEMAESGDWVTLRINNGIRYLEKAPFMYWLSAASVRIFGLSDWAMRLPVVLFVLFSAFLLFRAGTRFFDPQSGFYAGIVFLTGLGPYAFTRILLPDVMLAFFLALAFYFYLQVHLEPEAGRRLFGYLDLRCMGLFAAMALAVLTKGLVGVVFASAVIFLHILVTRNWAVLRRLQILPGIVLFLLIAAPWHLAAGAANKGFLWFYFVNEHFLRYLGLRYPKDYDTVPVFLFWVLHLVWLFPWTAFLWGFKRSFPRGFNPVDREGRVNLFLYVWILTILIFFSFSTTQEYYTFPTLPAFALLLGRVLGRLDSPEGAADQRKAVVGVSLVAGLGVITAGCLFALAWLGKGGGMTSDLSATLTVNPEQYALSFGHMHDLTPATFGHLAPLVLRTAVTILVGPLLALISGVFKQWKLAVFFLAVMMVGLLHSYRCGMDAFEPVMSSKGLARTIQYHYRPGDRVVVNGVYERGSSINYYTGIQLSLLNGHFGNLWYGSYYPDAPSIFFNDLNFLEIWNSGERVFLFSENQPLAEFEARHPGFSAGARKIANDGGKTVLVNW